MLANDLKAVPLGFQNKHDMRNYPTTAVVQSGICISNPEYNTPNLTQSGKDAQGIKDRTSGLAFF